MFVDRRYKLLAVVSLAIDIVVEMRTRSWIVHYIAARKAVVALLAVFVERNISLRNISLNKSSRPQFLLERGSISCNSFVIKFGDS